MFKFSMELGGTQGRSCENQVWKVGYDWEDNNDGKNQYEGGDTRGDMSKSAGAY